MIQTVSTTCLSLPWPAGRLLHSLLSHNDRGRGSGVRGNQVKTVLSAVAYCLVPHDDYTQGEPGNQASLWHTSRPKYFQAYNTAFLMFGVKGHGI